MTDATPPRREFVLNFRDPATAVGDFAEDPGLASLADEVLNARTRLAELRRVAVKGSLLRRLRAFRRTAALCVLVSVAVSVPACPAALIPAPRMGAGTSMAWVTDHFNGVPTTPNRAEIRNE